MSNEIRDKLLEGMEHLMVVDPVDPTIAQQAAADFAALQEIGKQMLRG